MALLCALTTACAGDPGSQLDWVGAGRELGEQLAADGRSRDEDNCAQAVRAYRTDVGVPQEAESTRAMMRGCTGR